MDMSTGSVCPVTKRGWEDAARASNCSKEAEYHCLRNENGKHSEKCIPKVWVPAEVCPEYNTIANKIDDRRCLARREDCPSNTYWSNEVYRYPKCLELSVRKSTFPTTSVAITQHATDEQPDTDSNITQPIIIAASSVVPIIFIVLIIICICYVNRRKHEQKDSATVTKDAERLTDAHESRQLIQNERIETQQPRNSIDVTTEAPDSVRKNTYSYAEKYRMCLDLSRQRIIQPTAGAVHCY